MSKSRRYPFRTMDDVRLANHELGHHWFEPATLRWFGSRVGSTLYGGRFFTTSERDPSGSAWNGQRRYSVREVRPDGSVDTASGFGEFASWSGADKAAQRMARESREG